MPALGPGLLRLALRSFFRFEARNLFGPDLFPLMFGGGLGKIVDYACHSPRCSYALVEVKTSKIDKAVRQLEEMGRELVVRGFDVALLILYVGRPGRQKKKYRVTDDFYLEEKRGREWFRVVVGLSSRHLPVRAFTARHLEVLRRRRGGAL